VAGGLGEEDVSEPFDVNDLFEGGLGNWPGDWPPDAIEPLLAFRNIPGELPPEGPRLHSTTVFNSHRSFKPAITAHTFGEGLPIFPWEERISCMCCEGDDAIL